MKKSRFFNHLFQKYTDKDANFAQMQIGFPYFERKISELSPKALNCYYDNVPWWEQKGYMLWFKFILGLMFFGLVSILFAIVLDYGNEYMTLKNIKIERVSKILHQK